MFLSSSACMPSAKYVGGLVNSIVAASLWFFFPSVATSILQKPIDCVEGRKKQTPRPSQEKRWVVSEEGG